MKSEEAHIDETLLKHPVGGFEVPERYFDTLHRDVMRKTAEQGFAVPGDYFDTLGSRIQERLPKPQVVRMKLVYVKRALIGIAASLLLVSGFFLFRQNRDVSGQATAFSAAKLDELSDEEIVNYVDAADLSDAHIGNIAVKAEDNTQKQMEEYLINNADEQLIMDAL